MSRNNGFVGESNDTKHKNEHFSGFLNFHMGVVQGVASRKPRWLMDNRYQYFDLYCGPGHNKYGDGSPMQFINTVQRTGDPFVAHFFDVNKDHIEQLKTRIPDNLIEHCNFYVGDNLMTCRPLLKAMRTTRGKQPVRLGLIYCDANGEPEWKILQYMSRVLWYERTDILINVCATSLKRKRGANIIDHYLTDQLVGISKKTWSVREPIGKQQWTMLLGMNWWKPFEWKGKGFYAVQSDSGRDILQRLNWSKKEIERHSLFHGVTQASLFDL